MPLSPKAQAYADMLAKDAQGFAVYHDPVIDTHIACIQKNLLRINTEENISNLCDTLDDAVDALAARVLTKLTPNAPFTNRVQNILSNMRTSITGIRPTDHNFYAKELCKLKSTDWKTIYYGHVQCSIRPAWLFR